jgi:multicomponent K+:H+ antiporter subunit E
VKRVLPFPGLSLALAALWLLLHNSITPATVFGAALIGLAAPWTLVPLQTPPLRIRNVVAALRLTGIVVYDIIRSNIAVATIILGGAKHARRSGFVAIPLDLRSEYGLALLATIITSTPGTLWAQHDVAERRMLLHVFDLIEEGEWIALVKKRYEPLLMEIFE